MNSTIILIGPICAGKSTLGKLLAEKVGLPHFVLDDNRWGYYEEIGYDIKMAAQIVESQGMLGLIRHWKPFEAHAVERAVAEYPNHVIDFGAGHSVYEDAALFGRVQQALVPIQNVILILPSPNLDESVAILNGRFTQLLQREVGEVDQELLRLNEHFVRHPSNQKLAKWVVYTNGKRPEESCDEILQRLKANHHIL